MFTRLLATLPVFILACGAGSGTKDGADSAAGPAVAAKSEGAAEALAGAEAEVARLFPATLKESPCDLLSADAVAAVAGVDASTLKQKKMMGMCIYDWEGGGANVGFIRAHDDVARAERFFESAHKDMSAAEVADAFDKIGEKAEEKLEADATRGEAKADPKHARPVAAKMGAAMNGGITWEKIDGVGDAAALETSRHENSIGGKTFVSFANKLDLRVGNLTLSVGFHRDEPALYRDEHVALARRVVDALPR